MLETNPDLTPAQVKAILTQTRVTTPENNLVGGRPDTLAAVKTAEETIADKDGSRKADETRAQARQILGRYRPDVRNRPIRSAAE